MKPERDTHLLRAKAKNIHTAVDEFLAAMEQETVYDKKLSPRQHAVLHAFDNDCATNKAVAKKLYIGVDTVNIHIKRIKEAFNTDSLHRAIALAVKHGLVDVYE